MTELEKDFYDELPGVVCELLDKMISKYSDEEWFEGAWYEYRDHVLSTDNDKVKMPGFIFNQYIDEAEHGYSDMFAEDELMHYGTPRHSGRYPWGSGDTPYQHSGDFYTRVNQLKAQGLSETEIAESMGMTTTRLRTAYSTAKDEVRRDKVAYAKSLKGDGLNNVEIGIKLGEKYNADHSPIGESTVRSLLNEDAEVRMNLASRTADELRSIVDKKGIIDIGVGVERQLNKGIGITSTKLNQAVDMLNMEGYEVYTIKVEQVTNKGNWTNVKLLCPPGTPYKDAYKAAKENKVRSVIDYAENITRDDGRPSGFIYPASLNSDRLVVRFDEDGGTLKDGVVEIRPGVKDLSLGNSRYSQVRILVDGTHYIKGMAVYGDPKDFPPGVDLIFNSNKSKAKVDKIGALKDISKNLEKDPTNPFGSAIKDLGGQSFYDDPNGEYTDPITGNKQSLSLINKRSDEGDWDQWSRELPSQFLSKQSKELITKQLKLSQEDKQSEFDDIMALTNPTVKKALLKDFADSMDADSVHLKAASLPGQTYKVILPLTSIKDDEVYAPHLTDGTKVALVRYPHGGTFEIPILTVNNRNPEGRQYLGTTPADAIGINKNVADRLSGADFDGDTVMVIPTNNKIKITSTPPLRQLEGFDNKLEYGSDRHEKIDGVEYGFRGDHKFKRMSNTQMEMGIISNLITDMTLKGATDEEKARAVKHSMVVIDAEKHWLDYRQSYIDNGIEALKKKYQAQVDPETGKVHYGASTLISKAKSPVPVHTRKEGAYFTKEGNIRVEYDKDNDIYLNPKTGEAYERNQLRFLNVDPNTGEKVYTYTDETFERVKIKLSSGKTKKVSVIEKNGEKYYKDEAGEYVKITNEPIITEYRTTDSPRMAETSDAYTLSSGTVQENLYADYANKLKALANRARKEIYSIEDIPYSPDARKEYREQVDSLEYKYNQALANKPKERQAQIMATSVVKAVLQENPGMDEDYKNKLKQTELKKARARVGASRNEIYIDDKEWEAIQAGAITKTMLSNIIMNANSERLKQLAMPRSTTELSPAKVARIKSMSNTGYTTDEIAKFLGVSSSTIIKYLKGKE